VFENYTITEHQPRWFAATAKFRQQKLHNVRLVNLEEWQLQSKQRSGVFWVDVTRRMKMCLPWKLGLAVKVNFNAHWDRNLFQTIKLEYCTSLKMTSTHCILYKNTLLVTSF